MRCGHYAERDSTKQDMTQDPSNKNVPTLTPATKRRRDERTERLAAALRENLKRRKQQRRARDNDPGSHD